MSDWMIIPEIENALIVFVEDPGDDEAGRKRVVSQLREAAKAPGTTPYIFYSPPDTGEEIHEWLSEFEERFAFAAQMPGSLGERMKFAFRRVLSRNAVKKAVLIGIGSEISSEKIAAAFGGLESHDIVLTPSAKNGCAMLGLRKLHGWLLDDINWESADAADSAEKMVTSLGFKLSMV